VGGSVAAPQPVKAFNHVGLGPTDEERSRELARMDKPKYKCRKLGKQPGSVSAQADGLPMFAADRAFLSMATAIDTLQYLERLPDDPTNKFLLILRYSASACLCYRLC
jgi:hypothetical protein